MAVSPVHRLRSTIFICQVAMDQSAVPSTQQPTVSDCLQWAGYVGLKDGKCQGLDSNGTEAHHTSTPALPMLTSVIWGERMMTLLAIKPSAGQDEQFARI